MKSVKKHPNRKGELLFLFIIFLITNTIRAAESESDFEDTLANGISWFAIIVAPIVGITVFLMVHILPEKIAEKKNHPQAEAIKTLCLLSLFFGGLLWPLAWLWTYTKPVFYKMAYGTDKGDYHEETLKEHKEAKNKATDENE